MVAHVTVCNYSMTKSVWGYYTMEIMHKSGKKYKLYRISLNTFNDMPKPNIPIQKMVGLEVNNSSQTTNNPRKLRTSPKTASPTSKKFTSDILL